MPFDREKIKKSVRAQMFGHWSVLGPLVGSALPFSYGLFIADDWKLSVFGGIVCLAGSLGAYAYRRLVKWDVLTDNEIEKEKSKFEAERNAIADKRERDLDNFRRELVSDGDSRDEHLLDDLRNAADSFRSDRTWVENTEPEMQANVLARVDTIFEACIANLKRSYSFRIQAAKIRGEGKRELLEASKNILDEVQTRVEELGIIFARVNKLSIKCITSTALDQNDARDNINELRALLENAERAEEMKHKIMNGSTEEDPYADIRKRLREGRTSRTVETQSNESTANDRADSQRA
jgi:hypothetical protein